MKQTILFLTILLAFVSCQSQTECCDFPEQQGDQALLGKYQVYEYGYSPGAGYVTEPVPATPLQYMQFGADGEFASNYQGFEAYKYYQIAQDSMTQKPLLSLYESKPSGDQSSATYSIDLDGSNVKLNYRFCIEGCHIGIREVQ